MAGMPYTEWCNSCLTADDWLYPESFTAEMLPQGSSDLLHHWSPDIPVTDAQETDCTGGMTHTEWCNPCLTADDRLHPKSFTAEEVSLEQMSGLRETGLKFCNVSAAEDLASTSFLSAAQLAAGQHCGQSPPLRYFLVVLLRACYSCYHNVIHPFPACAATQSAQECRIDAMNGDCHVPDTCNATSFVSAA